MNGQSDEPGLTFASLRSDLEYCLKNGYYFESCISYVRKSSKGPRRSIILRVDVDYSVKKAERLCWLLNELGIKGTFFFRLHASEYNLFSFENYRILRFIVDSGHEIGLHSEIVEASQIWGEDARECLRRDLSVIETITSQKVFGSAAHRGYSGINNLDFWKSFKPSDFDLMYEGYDEGKEFGLFSSGLYISDSEWSCWKCYAKGVLIKNRLKSFVQFLRPEENTVYLLMHPDTFYDRHFYE